MKKIAYLCLSFLVVGATYSCNKSEMESSEPQTQVLNTNDVFKINFQPAKTNSELRALRSKNTNMIKTESQLDFVLARRNTPLSKLSTDLIDLFKESVVFREGVGIVGYNYRILKANLNNDDYNTVSAYFGLDTQTGFWNGASSNRNPNARAMGEDYEGYKCYTKGTCIDANKDYICLDGC